MGGSRNGSQARARWVHGDKAHVGVLDASHDRELAQREKLFALRHIRPCELRGSRCPPPLHLQDFAEGAGSDAGVRFVEAI